MPCRRSVLTAALGAALLVPAPLRAASEDALLIDLRDGSGKLLRRFRGRPRIAVLDGKATRPVVHRL